MHVQPPLLAKLVMQGSALEQSMGEGVRCIEMRCYRAGLVVPKFCLKWYNIVTTLEVILMISWLQSRTLYCIMKLGTPSFSKFQAL